MLQIETAPAAELESGLTAVGIPVFKGADGPHVAAGLPASVGGVEIPTDLDAPWLKRQGFTGKVGQSIVLGNEPGNAATVLLGLGGHDDAAGEVEAIRRSAAAFVRSAGEGGEGALVIPPGLALDPAVVAAALAEGATLAAYRFSTYRTGDNHGRLDRVILAVSDGVPLEAVSEGAGRGSDLAASVSFARDLVNEPPSSLTPSKLAQIVSDRLGERAGVTVEVWDEDRIVGRAPGRAARRGPGFRRAAPPGPGRVHAGRPARGRRPGPACRAGRQGDHIRLRRPLLEDADGMKTMKTDMCGAAAVIAALGACRALGVRVGVTGSRRSPRTCPAGGPSSPVTCSRSATARRSRC